MRKKLFAGILSAALVVGSLAGCGGNDGGNSSSGSSKASEGEQQVSSDAEPSDAGSDAEDAGEDSGSAEGEKTAEEKLLEPYDEPVDIHIVLAYRESEDPLTPEDCTPETSTAVKLLKEEMNINLIYDWIANNDQYNEKFGAELAAGNLPDVFMVGSNDFSDLVDQGGLADLTEAYEEYRCDALDAIFNYSDDVIDVAKRDGKLYGLPMGTDPAQATSQIYYNMTQLASVGITSPDQLPKTIDEFEELCDKLMETDYDNDGQVGGPVLPATVGFYGTQLGDFTPFFHAYETWTGGWVDEGGELKYMGIDESLKEPLTKLNEWYEKGYFRKDWPAYDVYDADSVVVSDIVAGKFAIVPGSWWIPNWPLNSNKIEHPDSEWVIGPNLSLDGSQPKVMLSRFTGSTFVVAGHECEHPEAIFKMMYWSLLYTAKNSNPTVQAAMSEEEAAEYHSYVYTWLPYRIYSPLCLRTNFETINKAIAEGKTEISEDEAPMNDEFWGAWASYLTYQENPEDGAAWGTYFSRLAPDGGVANMIKTVESAEIVYNELYVTTPAMITKSGELNKLRDSTFTSMIMGETPISEFDAFVEQWKAQGGDEIAQEANEWYQSIK